MSEVWGRNLRTLRSSSYVYNPDTPSADCPGEIIDMQVRGSLYILSKGIAGHPNCMVQKWNVDGTREWSMDLPNSLDGVPGQTWRPLRIDSDDSLVWVVGEALFPSFGAPTNHGLYALNATDGEIAWTRNISGYDVDPKGDGSVYVAIGGIRRCEGIDLEPGSAGSGGAGSVLVVSSSGASLRGFGPDGGRSVLAAGGKVWVGAVHQETGCFCPELQAPIGGCVFRYDDTGKLELACAGGEWIDDEPGCKRQVPILVGNQNVSGYINRLCLSPSGTILAGTYYNVHFGMTKGCLLFEIDATTGRMLASYDIAGRPDSEAANVEALAADSSNIYVVSGHLLYVGTSGARRHRGYLTGTSPAKIVDGTYTAVTAAGGSMFVGGSAAGCVLHDDEVDKAIGSCDAGQPCECGDFNTRGQAVVGCGCEDGVDPTCAAYIQHSFTGCLANMPSPIPMVYQGCPSETCTGTVHRWRGVIPGWIPNPEATELDPCPPSLNGTVEACYICGTGWQLFYTIRDTVGQLFAQFYATITGEFCGPPSFTFTFDGSFHFLSEQAELCCGGTTGCGGFVNEQGCETTICGCSGIDGEDLAGTITNTGGCPEFDGATINFVQGMPGGQTWVGSLTTISCFGTRTFTLSCNDTTWTLQIDNGSCLVSASVEASSVSCDPFELKFSFAYNYIAMSACACCAFAGGSFEVTVTL